MDTLSHPATDRLWRGFEGNEGAFFFWGTVLFAEASLVMLYMLVTPVEVDAYRYIVYPFIWINLTIWVVRNARRLPVPMRPRALAAIAGIGYLLVLLAVPGKIALAGDTIAAGGLHLRMQVPGWGPIVSYEGSTLRVVLLPYETIGYAGLAYLVYLNLIKLTRSSLAGLLGVATCVGCTVPVLVPVLGVLGGTGTTLASTAYAWSYDVGTALFVVIVLVLYRSHLPAAD